MKIAAILFAFIVGSTELCAQQYQCLQPAVKQYFTNDTHYLRGMRIDSSVSVGTTTIFYPYHSPRFIGSTKNVDSAGGSWLGKKVLQFADGTTCFDNIWNDTVTIKTKASLGDSWIFYNDTSAVYYTATVTQVDTESVLGQLDSVKTIRITAMKGTTVLSTNPVNNYTLALSKNHGFVRIFDLYTFPYTVGTHNANDYFLNYGYGSTRYQFSRTEYHNPRNIDLYDFAVGDVFQMSSTLWNPSLTIYSVDNFWQDTIIAKSVSPAGISYTTKGYSRSTTTDYNGKMTPGYGPYIHLQTTIPDVTSQIVDSLRMPEETGNWFVYYYDPADKSHCTTSALYKRQHFYLVTPLDAPTNETETYKAGFGLIDSVNGYMWGSQGAQATFSLRMSASIKKATPCGGFPPPLAIVSPVIAGELFRVYPNPAGNTINVQYEGPSVNGFKFEVNIINLNGTSVYHSEGLSQNLSVNTAALPEGIYLLRMIANNRVSNEMLSIIH